ncbi:MAG: glycosyltransferase [Candidatus Electrothrix sp. EH2]|nr:glycosyltransferase [Candidatus Electrothrix sp. EH2]
MSERVVRQGETVDGISVIIPTFKRLDMCRTLFLSLQKSQQCLKEPSEIIIVDNSPPYEARQIEKLAAQHGARYYHKQIGVGAKRNFGARMAVYSVVLFVDSDCEADSELLQEHLVLYKKSPDIVAVHGRTNFTGPETFAWKATQCTPFLDAFRFADIEANRVWGPSNNLSFRKTKFEQIGGFDEVFPGKPGGEDVDLGYRMYMQGNMLRTNPQAVVFHTTETWSRVSQMVSRLFHWGRGEFYLYNNHEQHLYYDTPNASFIFLLLTFIGLVLACIERSGVWLILPLIFFAVNFVGRLIFHFSYHPERLIRPLEVLTAEIFIVVYENGLAFECLKRRWFPPMYHRLLVASEDALLNWNMQVVNTWSIFLEFVISVGFAQLITASA